jgi:hypothetical protein
MTTDTSDKESKTVTETQSFDDVPLIDFCGGVLPDFNRDERLIEIVVDNPECDRLPLCSGHLIPRGRSRILVREEDLPTLKTLVRTEQQEKNLAFAAEQFKRDQELEWDLKVQNFLANGGSSDPYDPEFRALKHENESKRLGSVVSTHVKLFRYEAPPLRSLTVIESGILNRRDVARVEAEKTHAAALAASMQTAIGGGASAASGEQSAMIASAVASAVAQTLAQYGIVAPQPVASAASPKASK